MQKPGPGGEAGDASSQETGAEKDEKNVAVDGSSDSSSDDDMKATAAGAGLILKKKKADLLGSGKRAAEKALGFAAAGCLE